MAEGQCSSHRHFQTSSSTAAACSCFETASQLRSDPSGRWPKTRRRASPGRSEIGSARLVARQKRTRTARSALGRRAQVRPAESVLQNSNDPFTSLLAQLPVDEYLSNDDGVALRHCADAQSPLASALEVGLLVLVRRRPLRLIRVRDRARVRVRIRVWIRLRARFRVGLRLGFGFGLGLVLGLGLGLGLRSGLGLG